MKEKPNHLNSILNAIAIILAVPLFVLASQTSSLAVQPYVAAGDQHTVGIKSDGTMVAVGGNGGGKINVNSWTDIVQVSTSDWHTVGVKFDGTMVAVGGNSSGKINVGSWADIVQVAAGYSHTVGVKSDGTVVVAGCEDSYFDHGQCNVNSWMDIVQVAAGYSHTVGVKSDGTVVAVGQNGSGECNLFDWELLISKNLLYTPVTSCRIVDTRKTTAGMIGAYTERDFHLFGDNSKVSAQGGNSAGCLSPLGEPLAAHINIIAVNPTGKGNLQAYPVGAGPGAGLSVNYNTIDTNIANAGTVKTVVGSGPDITVTSRFSSAHTVIDILGYYYPDEGFYFTPVAPCRIVDTRNTPAGIIDANTQRNFDVFGSVDDQGGNPAGCPSTLGVEPEAADINMVAVDPAGKGNLQAFPVGAGSGAGLSVNYNTIDTNLANAGRVKTVTGSGPDISVASNFSSAHTVIDVLGYYSEEEDLLYTPVTPCRIVDTRKTSAGRIDANTQRNFRVFGSVGSQGGDAGGCSSPLGEPLAAHINMVAVSPTGKGNLQAFPVGVGAGAGLSVNYNTIDTNLANAGTVKTVTGAGLDICVASNFSSAHTVIDVLGYYYPSP